MGQFLRAGAGLSCRVPRPQQVLVSLHRFRSRWIASRTAQINTLRGLLRELGFIIPLGAEKVVPQVRILIGDAGADIPHALRAVLATACDEIEVLSESIEMTEHQLEALAEQTPVVLLLTEESRYVRRPRAP